MAELWYTNFRNYCRNRLQEVIEGFETNVGYIVDCGFLYNDYSFMDYVV